MIDFNVDEAFSFKEKMRLLNGLFIGFVGYEARSVFLPKLAFGEGVRDQLLWSLESNKKQHSLDENLETFRQLNVPIVFVKRYGQRCVMAKIFLAIRAKLRGHAGEVDVHIDYSSMPRDWYCFIFVRIIKLKRINIYGWYAAGRYEKPMTFPCLGLGEWDPFFSDSRVTMQNRSTIIGLGLDWVRTIGILDVINPIEYYTVSAAPIEGKDLLQSAVEELNWEIIAQSQNYLKFSIKEFSRIYYGVRDLLIHLINASDVEVIPDGPKPLVLAMALAAGTLKSQGVHCWNVTHASNAPRLNIWPKGEEFVYGFCIRRPR